MKNIKVTFFLSILISILFFFICREILEKIISDGLIYVIVFIIAVVAYVSVLVKLNRKKK